MPQIPDSDLMPCNHGLRRQTIVQSLLCDIFQGKIAAGQHLVTQSLANRFGVIHSPIREALISLEGMGIVDMVPNRGAIVRAVTAREVREICQVRRLLECQATRSACGRIDLEVLHRLREEFTRLRDHPPTNISEFIHQSRLMDGQLHERILSSCGNEFLVKELRRLMVLFRAFRDVSYIHHEARNDYRRLAAEAGEHLAIVERLLAGDARAAAHAMAQHIRSGTRYWTRAMPSVPTTVDCSSRR